MAHEKLVSRLNIIQKSMELKLSEIRERFKHSGNKGSNVEEIIRNFILEYLPNYCKTGHGEIIDIDGKCSNQIDVIITNEHHPAISDRTLPSTFLIEGVAMAGEIKTILTKEELLAGLNNCKQFKLLSPVIQKDTTVYGNLEDINRFVNKRPYFLFAFESQIQLNTIKSVIEEYNQLNNLQIESQIDAIFVLSRGYIINFGSGNGALQFRNPKGESLPGYIQRPIEIDSRILYNFLGWISIALKRLSIPDPIISQYLFTDNSS